MPESGKVPSGAPATLVQRLSAYLPSLIAAALFLPPAAFAGAPLWTIVPITQTAFVVGAEEVRTIQYRVTNQSRKQHRLEMKPVPGIAQLTGGAGLCGRVFTLQLRESCLLTLQVDGRNVTRPIGGGPVVCSEGSAIQCYRPDAANSLDITPRL